MVKLRFDNIIFFIRYNFLSMATAVFRLIWFKLETYYFYIYFVSIILLICRNDIDRVVANDQAKATNITEVVTLRETENPGLRSGTLNTALTVLETLVSQCGVGRYNKVRSAGDTLGQI